jgi:PTS system sorbose-specific IIB component
VSLLLARIDDRLVHGQVVVGCCVPLRARRIILCDEEVAGDPLQRSLYRAATPPEIDLEVLGVEAAVRSLRELEATEGASTTILVVGSASGMLELQRQGVALGTINLGGLHYRPGRVERWPGFFVDDEELDALQKLVRGGLRVEVQSVPGAPVIDATSALASEGAQRGP